MHTTLGSAQSRASRKRSDGTDERCEAEAAQPQLISPPFIATQATPGWRSNGGSEAKKCAMAPPPSMLATAINTALVQEKTQPKQSACSDAQSRPETFPNMV